MSGRDVERGAANERRDILEELVDRLSAADDKTIRTPKWLVGLITGALGAALSLAAWYGSIATQVPANAGHVAKNATAIRELELAIRELERDLTHICASPNVSCRRH